MDCGLLYSGGKDSTLAALLLNEFYDLTLLTARFGVTDDWQHARDSARRAGFTFEPLPLDTSVAEQAVKRMQADGNPRRGIQDVHLHALETVAEKSFDAVADGTRRDDRVPSVSRAQAQRLEKTHGIDYLAPLSGFGRDAVDRLVAENLSVTVGPSEEIHRADYEAELRVMLREAHGADAVTAVFPDHDQTHVEDVR